MVCFMQNYKKMYYKLFNEISDIIIRLKKIQEEEIFISSENYQLTLHSESEKTIINK